MKLNIPKTIPLKTKTLFCILQIGVVVFVPLMAPLAAQAQSTPEDDLGLSPELTQQQAQQAAAESAQRLQQSQAESQTGEEGSCGAAWSAGFVLCAVARVTKIVKDIDAFILTQVTKLLGTVFALNIATIPIAMEPVQIGWTIMRDLANAFFIIIVLWIALTIIFNIEHLGGKKLLVRVIIVALLLNFSLAFVSVPFTLGNLLAMPFATQLSNRGGIADILTGDLNLQALTFNEGPTPAQVAAAEQAKKQFYQNCGVQVPSWTSYIGGLRFHPLWLLFGDKVKELDPECQRAAAGNPTIAENSLIIKKWEEGNKQVFYQKMIIDNVMVTIVLLFFIFLFLYISAYLLVRIAVIVFLSVIAPLAFLSYITPASAVQNHFHTWLKNVLQWSLFLPLLYLFLYIIAIITAYYRAAIWATDQSAASVPSIAEVFTMLIIVMALCIAAVRIAKMAGGKAADSVLSIAKGITMGAAGVATGGLAIAGGAAMGGLAARSSTMARAMTAFGKVPVIGRGAKRRMAQMGERVDKHAERDQYRSSDDVVGLYRSASSGTRKAALARLLAQRGDFSKLRPEEQQTALQIAESYNAHGDILENSPQLAKARHFKGIKSDEEARMAALRMVKDKSKVDFKAMTPEMQSAYWSRISTGDMKNLANRNPQQLLDLVRHYKAVDPATKARIDNALGDARRQAIHGYLNSAPGRAVLGEQFDFATPQPSAARRTATAIPATTTGAGPTTGGATSGNAATATAAGTAAATGAAAATSQTQQPQTQSGQNPQQQGQTQLQQPQQQQPSQPQTQQSGQNPQQPQTPGVTVATGNPVFRVNQLQRTQIITGGIPPYTISITPGSNLPSGLTFNSDGTISGTPAGRAQGYYTVPIAVTDSSQPPKTLDSTLSINVQA